MQEITREFSLRHGTITYPDGRTENVEFVEKRGHNEVVRFIDVSDDSWYAYYNVYTGEPTLKYHCLVTETKYLSVHNFESFEVDWTEELIAVAEVEVVEERENRLFRSDIVDRSVEPKRPDVTVWHKSEWEAEND